MKKRFGAVILAGAMACTMGASLALAGCGGHVQADFEMPEGGFDVTKEVEITFYHTMGQNLRNVLDAVIPKFNKLYPNIKITHRAPGGYDELKEQITTELLDNSNPDITYCYPDHVALYNSYDAVQSLNDFLPDGKYADEKVKQVSGTDDNGDPIYEEVAIGFSQQDIDNFIPSFYQEGSEFDEGDKLYCLPWSKSTEVMFYNKTFLDEHELEVPQTWDELEKFCEDVKKIDKSLYPFTYDSEANWFITMCEQLGSDYTSLDIPHFTFNNETNRNFVKRFAEWYGKGYFTTQIQNGNTYTSGLFTDQKSIMCIGSTGGTGYQMDESGEEAPFTVGIAPIPQVKPYDSTHEGYDADYLPRMISQGPSVCIFKNDDPQKVLASWLFAKYFTTSVEFQAQFSYASGYMPVMKREVMETNAVYKDFLEDTASSSALKALAVERGLEYAGKNYYYTSPAFIGSSKAREKVGQLMAVVFSTPSQLQSQFDSVIRELSRDYDI